MISDEESEEYDRGSEWCKTRSLEERRLRNKRARRYKCGNLCGNKKEHPGDY